MESHLSQQIPRGVFGRHHGIHAAVVLPRRLQSGRQDASLVVQPRGLQTVDQLEHLRLGVLFRGRKKRVEREREREENSGVRSIALRQNNRSHRGKKGTPPLRTHIIEPGRGS